MKRTDYEKQSDALNRGEVVYPDGYGQWATFYPIEELMRRHRNQGGASMEPEFDRRLTAYLIYKNGLLGIGDSWRPFNSPTSAASRANRSFHQDQVFHEGSTYFCAVDLVVVAGFGENGELIVRAPTREQVADAVDWGLHDMGTNKSWHQGPIEIRGHKTWSRNGRPRPETGYALPVVGSAPQTPVTHEPSPEPSPVVPEPSPEPQPVAPPAPPVAPQPTEQPTMQGRVNVNVQMMKLKKGMNGPHVEKLQSILNANFIELKKDHLKVDGDFGEITNGRVKNVQTFFGLDVDGIVGPITWNVLLTAPW